MVEKAVIVGAGGHCRVVLSILNYYPEYQIMGVADRDGSAFGEVIGPTSIRFAWEDFSDIFAKGISVAFIAIGDNAERRQIYGQMKAIGFKMPCLIHPSAILEKDVRLGEGTQVCLGVKIGTRVIVGSNCIIYTGSIIDHESIIKDDVFIAPGVTIAGRVNVNAGAFIGSGSSIINNICIGKGTVIGSGTVVIRDVMDFDRVAGIPAKSIKKKKP